LGSVNDAASVRGRSSDEQSTATVRMCVKVVAEWQTKRKLFSVADLEKAWQRQT